MAWRDVDGTVVQCPECGHEATTEAARFCGRCGALLSASSPNGSDPGHGGLAPRSRSWRLAAVAGIVALAVAAVLVAADWSLSHRGGGDDVVVPTEPGTGRVSLRPAEPSSVAECEGSAGCVAWAWQVDGDEQIGVPTLADGRVFVGAGSSLVELDVFRGEVTTEAQLRGRVQVAPAVTRDVVVAVDRARVYVLDRGDPEHWLAAGLPGGRPVDVEVVGDRAVVGTAMADGTGRVFGVGLDDGSTEWEVRLEGSPTQLVVDRDAEPPVVFAADTAGTVTALQTPGGKVPWTADHVGQDLTWVDGRDLLVVTHDEGRLTALDAADGGSAWQLPQTTNIPTAYVSRWDRLYLMGVSAAGQSASGVFLNMIDPATGQGQARAFVDPLPLRPSDDVPEPVGADANGWLYLSTGNSLSTVHPTTGEVISTVRVPDDQRLTVAEIASDDVPFAPLPATTGQTLYAIQPPPAGEVPLVIPDTHGDGCPTSPVVARSYGHVITTEQGQHDAGGFELSIPSVTPDTRFDGTTIFDRTEPGEPLTVRGAHLAGHDRLGVRTSRTDAFAERITLNDRGRRTAQDMPPHWVVDIDFPTAGCWGIQLDTPRRTQILIFTVPKGQSTQQPD